MFTASVANMEIEQSLLRVANTSERLWEVWGTYPVQDFLVFLVFLVQEIVWLIVVCVFWWLFFYKLYHPFKIYFQVRHCRARQNKLLKDHWDQSEKEQAAVELHWPLADVHPQGHAGLHQRKNMKQSSDNRGKDAMAEVSNGGVAKEVLVPVMMCCKCTLRCAGMNCKRRLKNLASKLRASCEQHITCLEADLGFVAVQTQLHLEAETVDKLRKIAAKQFCNGVTVQLGRWRAYCLIHGEVKSLNMESVSSDESDRVPVILNSSYKGGMLTVEGLNLAKASIKIVNKHGDCITLETKCNGVSSEPGVAACASDEEPSLTFTKGSGGLEQHTYKSELSLEEQSVAELSVIAFKKITKDNHEVRVSSQPVQIRDDSLRTVLRDIFPSALIVFYAAKQILSSVGYATLIVAWLISFMIVALTSTLPESTETTIKHLLKKMTAHASIFYDAYQIFMYEADDSDDEEDVHDSESEEDANDLENEEADNLENEEDAEDLENDGESSSLKVPPLKLKAEVEAKSNFVATHASRFVTSADWQWPIYDTKYDGQRSYLELRQEESKDEKVDQSAKTVPFEVIYLNLISLPWANQVEVNVSSSFLKGLLPVKMDPWKCKKKVSIDGPELFRNYENLSKQRMCCVAELDPAEPSSSADASSNMEKLQHITHLVRFMDKEFEEIKPMYEGMEKKRRVTWEMLWAFFPPGERVVYVDDITDECVCGEVLWTDYRETEQGLVLIIKVTKWDYNCKSWSEYTDTVTMPQFAGDRAIQSLNVRPFRIEEDPIATERTFLNHGKRFCELSMMQSNCYMNYKGSMVSYIRVDNCLRVAKENADGRVMIDLGSFSKMNPDYPLGSAKPPCEIIRDNIVITLDITQKSNRMFAPSLVYGFSFRLKKWGCFSVAGFSDIDFNDSAYDNLVMDPDTKALTYSLVQERLKEGSKKEPQENDRVDPIANKGDGCILLCYGPPGTGKTLTAESLSEKLQCPLWCLSVFELGVTPAALETMLVKVLDVAASWGAILLLDEADVYLERRSCEDLVRNSMTGVFLRHLEYYRGVLFLTTNRDSTFDEAICSRITMFLYYGRHNEHQRSLIWRNLFRRVGLEDNIDENLADFSKPDFNGREITKIMKTAQTLAKCKGEKLEFQHVREALKVYEESSKLRTSLNSSTGVSLPVHQQLTKFLEVISNSGFAATPPELHPSSSETTDLVDDRPPEETPSSSKKIIEETPSSATETIPHVPTPHDLYLS